MNYSHVGMDCISSTSSIPMTILFCFIHSFIQAMTATARALREATNPEAMKLALICAVTLVDELAWEAYDLNNKRLRPGFVVLRGDKDATGPPALYNRKLAEIYNSGGEIFLALRGQSPVLENLAAAIPKLSMCASVTHAPPYSYSDVEVAEALLAAQAMLNFAKAELRV
jgi:hypothetical protein